MKKIINNEKTALVSLRNAPTYKENPFLGEMVIKTKNKRLTVGNGTTLVDHVTGEIVGTTSIVENKSVNVTEFVKLFTADALVWFDFDKTSSRVFACLLTIVQKEAIGRDRIYIQPETIQEMVGLAKNTVYKGLATLIAKGIIARHAHQHWYYINPKILFNGDEVSLVKRYRIERNPKKMITRDPNTLDMITGLTDNERIERLRYLDELSKNMQESSGVELTDEMRLEVEKLHLKLNNDEM
jgi:hypothetical protein